MNDGHLNLVKVCAAIGSVAECNNHFTEGLANRLARGGLDLESMTVRDLMLAIDLHNKDYSRIHGGAAQEVQP